jgi:UDP-glucose 4-epimerase
MINSLCVSDANWGLVVLRYFNPVGAHPSGLIGQAPNGVPSNRFPYISKVATHKLPIVKVFGNDYATVDGTGVRDYLHVCDLAEGHVRAIAKLKEIKGAVVIN